MFAHKASLSVFSTLIVTACDEAKIGLEDWQTQHSNVWKAEMGKIEWKDGKAGIAKISKGAKGIRGTLGKATEFIGPAHPCIKFQRECDMAESYIAEFKTAKVFPTEDSAAYIRSTAQRVAELLANKTKPASQKAVTA